MNVLKKTLLGAGVGAIIAVIGSSAAMAAPIFTINPTAVGYPTAVNLPGTSFQATDLNFSSVATVTQTGATTQTEVGYARLDSYTLNGIPVDQLISGLAGPASYSTLNAPYYGAYFTFTATVEGLSSFAPGGSGTVTSFNFQLFADPNTDSVFTVGTCGGGTCSNPTVAPGAADLLLAHGSLIVGSAGFQPATGAPTLAATTTFIVDNNAYFAAPIPFYNIALTSTTANSGQVIGSSGTTGVGSAITINGINGGANFVPEPLTLSLFGAGLVGAAALRRRKSKKKA